MASEIQQFSDECLIEHNRLRKCHSAIPLKQSSALCKSAQEWAKALLEKECLENSPLSGQGEVGENISMRTSSVQFTNLSGIEVANQWYSDIKNYEFSNNTGPAGNFTQLVWLDSKEVGFGKAHKDGTCIVVAHYKPPGNIKNKYSENVRRHYRDLPEGERPDVQAASCDDIGVRIEERKRADDTSYLVRIEQVQSVGSDGQKTMTIQETEVPPSEVPIHRRTSSMSSDEKFEAIISPQADEQKLSSRSQRNFVREIIHYHNIHRCEHDAPKLKHNQDLDLLAQRWAEFLINQKTLSNSNSVHRGNRLGENIASRWSNGPCDYSGREVAEHWYAEKSKFRFNEEPISVQGIGNFTQMIWMGSREIGVGKTKVVSSNGDAKVIIVCLYYPAGNVISRFTANVLPANVAK